MNSCVQVSIIMPVYNGSMFLKSAIESILQQTYICFELVIINDGSTDESESIIHSFSDQRILYIHHKNNMGLVAALNSGISAASGKYIARMDQDDLSLPDRIGAQFEFMEQHDKVVLLGTQLQVLWDNKISHMYKKNDELKTSLLVGSSFAHPTVMMRASTIEEHNIRYEEAYLHAEDYGFWSQISQYGEVHNLNQVGLLYRKHSNQYTRVFTEQMKKATRRIRKDYTVRLGLTLTDVEFSLLNSIAEKTYLEEESFDIKEAANLLNMLVYNLPNLGLNKKSVEKVIYSLWLQLCGELQKKSKYSMYREFKMFKKDLSLLDIKVHGWFLKKYLTNYIK